eukprot:1179907-Prorocentrum_minimum.AAC.4
MICEQREGTSSQWCATNATQFGVRMAVMGLSFQSWSDALPKSKQSVEGSTLYKYTILALATLYDATCAPCHHGTSYLHHLQTLNAEWITKQRGEPSTLAQFKP